MSFKGDLPSLVLSLLLLSWSLFQIGSGQFFDPGRFEPADRADAPQRFWASAVIIGLAGLGLMLAWMGAFEPARPVPR